MGESRVAANLRSLGSGNPGFDEKVTGYNPDLLEYFENRSPQFQYWIRLVCSEFTSVCPKTGQPDWGVLFVNYIPRRRCVESKSLKLYLTSFRNHGAFHEDVVNTIASDLFKLLSPCYIEVLGRFHPRGGIAIYPLAVRHSQDFHAFAEKRMLAFPSQPEVEPKF